MTDLAAQTQLEKYQKAAASLDKFLEQATDDQKFDLAKKMAEEKLLLVTLDEAEREKILEKLIEKNVITDERGDKIEQENVE